MQSMLRSAVLAVGLGEALGLPEGELAQIYYFALLRWVGCTSDASISASVFGDELAMATWFAPIDKGKPSAMMGALLRNLGAGQPPLRRVRLVAGAMAAMPQLMEGAAGHCEVGKRLAERLSMGSEMQSALQHAYERWDGRGLPARLRGEAIALPARVVAVAQDAGLFYGIGGIDAAVAVIRERAGGAHDPTVATTFCEQADRLLRRTETESTWEAVLAAEPGSRPRTSGDEFDTALRAMADFIDLKSPYLGNHSSGVAELAAEAARRCRLSQADVHAIRRAALVHDIGRVGVSSAIWNKVGALTDEEWERVRLHSYYTERVLSRSEAFAALGSVAALHHERLDGTGYHRCIPAAMLSPSARILAAADVYHALTELRPHRAPLQTEQAAAELRIEVRAGRIDADAADAVLAAAGHRVHVGRRSHPGGLSEREIEVLQLIARGLTKRQMAEHLVVSSATVDHHIRHIYNKIGTSTRAGATLFALQHDLM